MLKTLSVTALMFACCVSASAAEAATVHFYRASGFWGRGVKASIYVDEALIAKLPRNTVAVFKLPPGPHVFRGVNKMEAVRLNLSSGNDYYLAMVITEGISGQVLQDTAAQEAQPIVSKLKPIDKKDVVRYLRHRRDHDEEPQR